MNKRLPLFLFVLLSSTLFVSCLNSSNSGDTPSRDLFETIQESEDFETFTSLAGSSGFDSTLSQSGPLTVFAPTDDAFAALPDGVLDSLSLEDLNQLLRYHVLEHGIFISGFEPPEAIETIQGEDIIVSATTDSLFINDATVIGGNYQATNGIIHITDQVLFPDSYLNVIGVISKRYNLSSLQAALNDAKLISTLEEKTQDGYTILAPSDEALEDTDLPDDQEQLRQLLEYHIIPQKLLTSDLDASQTVQTLQGEEVTIEVDGNTITINGDATITATDLEGTNGVVHILDSALAIPPSN